MKSLKKPGVLTICTPNERWTRTTHQAEKVDTNSCLFQAGLGTEEQKVSLLRI